MTPAAKEKLLKEAFAEIDPSRQMQAIQVLQILAKTYPTIKQQPAVQLRLVRSVRRA